LAINIKFGFIQHRFLPLKIDCEKFVFCYQLNEPMGYYKKWPIK
jgi:hypothetical protein